MSLIVLGVDPGSLVTGYGIIEVVGNDLRYLDSGCIRTARKSIPQRLKEIFQNLTAIINQYQPDTAAIEQVFMHTNPGAALKLGQARGAAIAAMMQAEIEVSEYSARQIKKALVGTGAAAKNQIQHMIKKLLKLNAVPATDAADALAVAICHINMQRSLKLIDQATSYRGRRLR